MYTFQTKIKNYKTSLTTTCNRFFRVFHSARPQILSELHPKMHLLNGDICNAFQRFPEAHYIAISNHMWSSNTLTGVRPLGQASGTWQTTVQSRTFIWTRPCLRNRAREGAIRKLRTFSGRFAFCASLWGGGGVVVQAFLNSLDSLSFVVSIAIFDPHVPQIGGVSQACSQKVGSDCPTGGGGQPKRLLRRL